MKYFLALVCAFSTASALATTTIDRNTIQYTRTMSLDHGERLAAIGGKVDFTGTDMVYVTLTNGGQYYTSPTDPQGHYSFLIWTNANEFQTWAWLAPNSTTTIPIDPARLAATRTPESVARGTIAK